MKETRKIKEKSLKLTTLGFTLIELLAVIVILAIIALIAVPIILNIIEDSKNSANTRSKELYLHGVEISLVRKNVTENFEPTTCTVKSDGNLTCDVGELIVETGGSKPKAGGTITFKDGKITGNTLEFGTSNSEQEKLICTLQEGNSKEVGSKYTCTLDEDRTFYVLENNESSDKITLIMDRNYTDADVPATMTWCNQSGSNLSNNLCNHDGLNPYIEKIQSKFGIEVKVGIPSYDQIYAVNNSETLISIQWLYDYLERISTGVFGYWTSTGHSSDSDWAWSVRGDGTLGGHYVVLGNTHGLRPVITISKSDLS